MLSRLAESTKRLVIKLVPDGRVRGWFKSVYWALPYSLRAIDPANDIVRAFAAQSSADVSVVQIGANDGSTGDFWSGAIRGRGWPALLVEPHPETFKKLQLFYQNQSNARLLNFAIGTDETESPLYYVPDNSLVASFRKDHVERYANKPTDVRSVIVKSVSIARLCEENGVQKIDLLAIDTEGYDAEIIQTIDFSETRIQAILFETTHLSDEAKASCFALLAKAGYTLLHGDFDSVAVDSKTTNRKLKTLIAAYSRKTRMERT